MPRPERGKGERHARENGWLASSTTTLKYCCHKAPGQFASVAFDIAHVPAIAVITRHASAELQSGHEYR
jgi:hypothetical protein